MEQRLIKFRAFWRDTLEPIDDFSDEYLIDACNDNIFIVDQFTGLLDKHGKEIYCGDLVKHEAWNYPFEVVFDQQKARFVCKLKGGLTQYIANDKLEIIGNIHQIEPNF